jgi:hypothetical protein
LQAVDWKAATSVTTPHFCASLAASPSTDACYAALGGERGDVALCKKVNAPALRKQCEFLAHCRLSKDASDARCWEISPGITRLSATDFVVARDVMDGFHAHPERLLGAVRIIPSFRDDAIVGYKLFAVRGTPLAALGFANADLLSKIDGMELQDEHIQELYSRLERASHLTVELQRDGKLLTFNYAVK